MTEKSNQGDKPSINIRKIIHVDMDAFFASVEQRDNEKYRGRPVVVGGSPESRGVVAAASYEARQFGIRSAMPSRTARARCPGLIFVKPRFEVYKEVSDQIRDIFRRYTDLVEPLSLDEAFLDVTCNKQALPSATLIARDIKEIIREETGLTASAGISINKFLAKIASDMRKPDGLYLIPPDKVEEFIENLAIEKFFGVGKVTAERMRSFGIFKGRDLKRFSERELMDKFGKAGSYFYHIARGIDHRPVTPDRVRKSIGAERSYATDLSEEQEFIESLENIADILLRRVEKSGTTGRTLTLKVKYADYQQVTRSKTLNEPPLSRVEIMTVAKSLLETTEVRSRNARLLGISLSNLNGEDGEDDEPQAIQLTLDFN